MSLKTLPAGLAVLMCAGASWATPITADDPHVTTQHGVLIIHGHVDQPSPVPGAVDVLQPMFDKEHDPYANWRAWAPRFLQAVRGVLPAPQPPIVEPAPPWQYTPSDQTYTPKTDWTYHPRVRPYTPIPTGWYTPKVDWTFHPKQFHSW